MNVLDLFSGMSESFLKGRVVLHTGDCLDVLARLEDNSIDSCVTDPPYHLTAGKKGGTGIASLNENSPAGRARISTGFMGKVWDGGDIAFRPEVWAQVFRVLKPGGYVLAFSGTRTYHRMACAIEDAGFDVRDMVSWIYGSGFPKSHNLKDERDGWGTALKPALEPICMARKPLIGTVAANVLVHGTGAINIDACRVDAPDGVPLFSSRGESRSVALGDGLNGSNRTGEIGKGRWPANVIHDGSEEVTAAFPETTSGTLTAEHRRDGGYSNGRENEIFGKGSQRGCDPNAPTYAATSGSAARFFYQVKQDDPCLSIEFAKDAERASSRLFYSAKADSNDRIGSRHPTVKPVDLMQYLVRLVTRPGGTVLDPFSGTGTTGEAAWREGMNAVLIEREAEYQADIRRRMKLCLSGPDERAREGIKAKLADKPIDAGPLFESLT